VAVTFAGNGALFGSWAPRIPEVKAELGLSSGVLGLTLLGLAVGSMASLPLGGAAATRFGSPVATRTSYVLFCLVGPLVGLATGAVTLFLALLLWGVFMGALDVTMNSQGVSVERAYGRSVLSGFHAAFSLGALAGAGVGSAAAELEVPVALHLAVTALVLVAVWVPVQRRFVPDPGHRAHDGTEAVPRLFARPSRTILGLGVAAFAVLLAEGAVADWSAVHLREDLGAGSGAAGLAFVAFSATMTIGRLAGDRVLTRFGRRRTVQVLSAAAASGLALGLLSGTSAGAILGFAVLGLGIACVFPALLSEVGDGLAAPGPALAAVSTFGYTGFLVGPPLIGLVAELVGLRGALGMLPLLVALAAVAVTVAGQGRQGRQARPEQRSTVG